VFTVADAVKQGMEVAIAPETLIDDDKAANLAFAVANLVREATR
jgi:hypothetical protein